jgi:hypothetical protein
MPLLHEVPESGTRRRRKRAAIARRKNSRERRFNRGLPASSREISSEFEQLNRRWKRLLPQLAAHARN